MGQIDTQTKTYVKQPEVFADLFNHLLYDGRDVVKPELLKELDTTEIAIPYGESGKSYPVQKFRDVLKNAVIMEDTKLAYVLILGIENQTDIHYAMPVRNMVYDALNYASQVSVIAKKHKTDDSQASNAEYLSGLHKDDRLTPVVTLVVYFGQEPWDGPLSIHEMLPAEIEEISQYIPDYKINLIAPVSMSNAEIAKFRSDFKELAGLIQCGHDKNAIKNLVESDERFRHMDPLTASIINTVTGSGLKIDVNNGGEFDMCAGIAGIREEGIAEGMAEGMAKGRAEGMAKGRTEGENTIFSLIQKLFSAGRGEEVQRISEDPEYRLKVMKEFGLA